MDPILMDQEAVSCHSQICCLMKDAIGMQSFGRLTSIAYWLMRCENVPGDVVEFGCYKGATLTFMAALTKKRVWGYDSFEGNPDHVEQDGLGPDCKSHHLKGGNKASTDDVLIRFQNACLPAPTLIKGFFADLKPEQLPEKIAFAHIDANFYESTKQALGLILPRRAAGSMILIDDFAHPELLGVARATAVVIGERNLEPLGAEGSQGVIHRFISQIL